jgi:hypothetical protein
VRGGDAASVLAGIGCSEAEVSMLQAAGIVGLPHDDGGGADELAAARLGRGGRS